MDFWRLSNCTNTLTERLVIREQAEAKEEQWWNARFPITCFSHWREKKEQNLDDGRLNLDTFLAIVRLNKHKSYHQRVFRSARARWDWYLVEGTTLEPFETRNDFFKIISKSTVEEKVFSTFWVMAIEKRLTWSMSRTILRPVIDELTRPCWPLLAKAATSAGSALNNLDSKWNGFIGAYKWCWKWL